MKMRILLTLFLFATLLGLGVPTALAAPRDVCLSNANGNWNATTTWSCDKVPTSSDIVIINNNHTVTLDTNGAAYQLIVGGGASGVLTHDGNSRTLTVGAGGVSVSNGGTFNSPSTLSVSGGMTVHGTFNGGSATITVGGDVNNQSGATFTATSGTITISGNVSNSGTFNHNNGMIVMSGSAAKSISGVSTFNNLRINNAAGINLTSNATVVGTLTLDNDLQVASGYALTMGASSNTSGDADVVGKVQRAHTFTTNTAYTFGSAYTTITFTGGTPPSNITVELFKTAPGGLANAVQRYYSITPTGGSGYTFDLRLHYRDAELNSIPENDLQMWQQVNGRWTLRARTSNDTSNNWVEKTGLTSFSLWALSNSGAPTAVNLSTFDARADAPNALPFVGLGALAVIVLGAMLRWKTKDGGQ